MKPRSNFEPRCQLLLCLAAVFITTLFVGCQQKVAVPKKFKRWNCANGAFAIEYPMLWLPEAGNNKQTGLTFAKFEKGGVSIRIDAEQTQGGLAGLGGPRLLEVEMDREELPEERRREAALHQKNLKYYTENYDDYQEGPAITKQLPIGGTRISEFTATEGFGKIRGIRATTRTGSHGITYRAYCPEAQWEDFKPLFNQLLDTLDHGVATEE